MAEPREQDREEHTGQDASETLARYRDRLYGFIRRELRYYESLGLLEPGEVSALDILDDVFASALRGWQRRPTPVLPWLYRLALHRLRQVLRAARARPNRTVRLELPAPQYAFPEELDEAWWEFYQPDDVVTWEDVLPDESAPPPDAMELRAETMQQVEALLNQLPAREREVFVLATFEDLSPEEIARLLGVSLEQVQRWLQRARERVRRALTERLDQTERAASSALPEETRESPPTAESGPSA